MNNLAKWLFATVLFMVFGLMDAFIFEALAQTNEPNTSFSTGAEEPPNLLKPDRDPATKKSLFLIDPLRPMQNVLKDMNDTLKEKYVLDIGLSITTAYTVMSKSAALFYVPFK